MEKDAVIKALMHCRPVRIPRKYREEIQNLSKETQDIIEKLKEIVPEGKHELIYRLEELYSVEKNICAEIAFKDGLKVGLLISEIVDEDD